MSENPNIQKALKILCDLSIGAGRRDALDALDDAGLITTPLHERALKTWEEYAHGFDGESAMSAHEARLRGLALGRESLAAKQPKERFVMRQSNVREIGWVVDDTLVIVTTIGCLTEAQARAVARALNETEGK